MQSNDQLTSKGILRPWWVLLVITLPQLLLLGWLRSTYMLVRSLLKAESQQLWANYATVLVLLIAVFTTLALILLYKRKPLPSWLGLLLLAIYLPLLYTWSSYSFTLLPLSIPTWMVDRDEFFLNTNAVMMLVLLYSTLVIVGWWTPEERRKRAWMDFLGALAIPLGWYFLLQVINAGGWRGLPKHALPVFLMLATVAFVFLMLRGVYIVVSQRGQGLLNNEKIWHIVFTLFCPILGLVVYSGPMNVPKIVGDLSHQWFPILAICTGFSLTLHTEETGVLRWLQFGLRALFYPFTLLFFFLFLPFLPFSLLAIIAVGVGILMLTPLVQMFLHSRRLWDDARVLAAGGRGFVVATVFLLGMACIPTVLILSMQEERRILHAAMDYVFQPQSVKRTRVDVSRARLRRAFRVLRGHKGRSRWLFSSGSTSQRIPLISTFYQRIVLDNMSLSTNKIARLERIFLGDPSDKKARKTRLWQSPKLAHPRSTVKLDRFKVHTTYDKKAQLYRSTVDLELLNPLQRGLQEYQALIQLPQGVWMSQYYLWVGKKKTQGLLVEKKSALWIYRQITRGSRDPGLITHERGNWWRLRVFPFAPKQRRRTGWTLLHKTPVTIQVGKQRMQLKPSTPPHGEDKAYKLLVQGQTLYLSPQAKRKLPLSQRTPYLHLILDCSTAAQGKTQQYNTQIQALLKKHAKLPLGKISLVNAQLRTLDASQNWKAALQHTPKEGGFFLQRAFANILRKHHARRERKYPVLVVLSPKPQAGIYDGKFDALSFLLPESDGFFVLRKNGTLQQHWLSYPANRPPKTLPPRPIRRIRRFRRLATPASQPNTKAASRPTNASIPPTSTSTQTQNTPTSQATNTTTTRPQTSAKTSPAKPKHTKRTKPEPKPRFRMYPVVAWPNARKPLAFVRLDKEASIVLLPGAQTASKKPQTRLGRWAQGLALHGQWLRYQLGEGQAKSWVNMIKRSWKTHLLTPLTAFTVLENEAQWETLRRKQKEVLAGKRYLDIPSDARRMPEPPFWLLILLLALCASCARLWQRRTHHPT